MALTGRIFPGLEWGKVRGSIVHPRVSMCPSYSSVRIEILRELPLKSHVEQVGRRRCLSHRLATSFWQLHSQYTSFENYVGLPGLHLIGQLNRPFEPVIYALGHVVTPLRALALGLFLAAHHQSVFITCRSKSSFSIPGTSRRTTISLHRRKPRKPAHSSQCCVWRSPVQNHPQGLFAGANRVKASTARQ